MFDRPEPKVVVRVLTDEDRADISQWRYEGELSIYDPGSGAANLRGPDHVALASANGHLIGYGTFGPDAQVPGGVYLGGPGVVDLGMGMRPALVGRGQGADALRALVDDAERRLAALRFRVTVASANGRATAFVAGAGFRPTHQFERESDGRVFVQYELVSS